MFKNILLLIVVSLPLLLLAELSCRLDGAYFRYQTSLERRRAASRSGEIPISWIPEEEEGLNSTPDAEEELRILAVGDSFTHGVALGLDRTWPKELERILNLRKSGRKYRVINSGRAGAGLRDEIEMLKDGISRFHPKLIIHQIFLNDFFGDPLEDSEAPKYFGPNTTEIPPEFVSHLEFYLWRYLHQHPLKRNTFVEYVKYYGHPDRRGWNDVARIYKEFYDTAKAEGVEVVTVLFPSMVWKGEEYPFEQFHQTVQAVIKPINPNYLDLLPEVQPIVKDGYAHWLDQGLPDAHPDEEMQKLFAKEISEFAASNF